MPPSNPQQRRHLRAQRQHTKQLRTHAQRLREQRQRRRWQEAVLNCCEANIGASKVASMCCISFFEFNLF